MKMAKRPVPLYDFKAFGAAIKAARNEYGESRKKVSDELYISPASIFAGSGYTPYACYVTFPHYYDTTTPPFCPQNAKKNKRTLDFSKEADYIPESCDHNGHHHG